MGSPGYQPLPVSTGYAMGRNRTCLRRLAVGVFSSRRLTSSPLNWLDA